MKGIMTYWQPHENKEHLIDAIRAWVQRTVDPEARLTMLELSALDRTSLVIVVRKIDNAELKA